MYQPESPFPYRMPNGAQITDERCKCGAKRSEHNDTIAYGHGARVLDGNIVCKKFAWAGWVYTSMNMLPGFDRLDDVYAIKIETANRRAVGAKGYRYEIRDMSKGRDRGANVLDGVITEASSRREAFEIAKAALKQYLAKNPRHELAGGAL